MAAKKSKKKAFKFLDPEDYEWIYGEFKIDKSELDGCKVAYAEYSYEDYSGSGYVVFIKDGVLYTVYGSHCSCYGLEGQWDPCEASPDVLINMQDSYRMSASVMNELGKQLKEYMEN